MALVVRLVVWKQLRLLLFSSISVCSFSLCYSQMAQLSLELLLVINKLVLVLVVGYPVDSNTSVSTLDVG